MKKARLYTAVVFVLAVVAVLLCILFFSSKAGGDSPVFPRSTLTITRTDGAVQTFDVEVATTPEQLEYGLMFRRSVPRDSGMLFIFGHPLIASFWMKNTFIPLDMLFVRQNGTIAKIIPDTKPFDLTPLWSNEPVMSVIELNGGEAAQRGIKAGDKVRSPALNP
jgi:hypothetical protein